MNRNALSKKSWTHYQPAQESIEDIVTHTSPQGKRVLCVAAYGYPVVFLANGACEVVSFDVSPEQVAWNYFLKSSILNLEYGENRSFFKFRNRSENDLLRVQLRIQRDIPQEYRDEAIRAMKNFATCSAYLKDRADELFPHIRDEATYDKAKDVVSSGGWVLEEKELLDLLGSLSDSERFDVIYASSIRNWTLRFGFEDDATRFSQEYDQRLGGLVSNHLTPEGLFYEALPFTNSFPRTEPTTDDYPLLVFEKHPSVDQKSRTEIVIGRKS